MKALQKIRISGIVLLFGMFTAYDCLAQQTADKILEDDKQRKEIMEVISKDPEMMAEMMQHIMSNREVMMDVMQQDTSMLKMMIRNMMYMMGKDSAMCNRMGNVMMDNRHMMGMIQNICRHEEMMEGDKMHGHQKGIMKEEGIMCPMHRNGNMKQDEQDHH